MSEDHLGLSFLELSLICPQLLLTEQGLHKFQMEKNRRAPIEPKDDPQKLGMRAEELKLKAASLFNEAHGLVARAERIEAARKELDEG